MTASNCTDLGHHFSVDISVFVGKQIYLNVKMNGSDLRPYLLIVIAFLVLMMLHRFRKEYNHNSAKDTPRRQQGHQQVVLNLGLWEVENSSLVDIIFSLIF